MDETMLLKFLNDIGVSKIKKTNSSNLSCSCPFAPWSHSKNGRDDIPSFSIEIAQKSRWNCFACGARGNSVRSLCKRLSETCGEQPIFKYWEEYEDGGKQKDNYSLKLFSSEMQKPKWAWNTLQEREEVKLDWSHFEPMTKSVAQYALDRGITLEQYNKWKLGWNKEDHRLFIPVFSVLKKFVGYSQRTILPPDDNIPKYKHCRGFLRNNYLYGEEFLSEKYKTCVLVEGFMKVFALDRMGFNNVFAPMGTALSDKQLHLIHRYFDTVIIFPDNDEINVNTGIAPGAKAAREWEKLIKSLGKNVIISPVIKNKKDVDDWTRSEMLFVLNILIRRNPTLNLPLNENALANIRS